MSVFNKRYVVEISSNRRKFHKGFMTYKLAVNCIKIYTAYGYKARILDR